jgi:hypothetical protein
MSRLILFALLTLSLFAFPSIAESSSPDSYSPYAGDPIPMNVYWGDTHLHSLYSADANAAGNLTIGPDEAYRFARGEEITAHNGMAVRLMRPLDFLAVSDHAAYLGVMPALRAGSPELLASERGRALYELMQAGGDEAQEAVAEVIDSFIAGQQEIESTAIQRSAWKEITASADRNYDPGRFTTFAAYEWTSMPERGNNLHRVVVFRDSSERTTQIQPFSVFDSEDPADLWRFLADYEEKTGGRVLAIPHNSNASNGLMFGITDFEGEPIDSKYAEERIRWEPLVEVTQIKGDSETHPLLSPNDEFADYGRWDRANLLATATKQEWMLKFEYVRSALMLGLQLERTTGVNPYKLGMIGSSDAHTGLAAVREENFWGKATSLEPSSTRVTEVFIPSPLDSLLDIWSWEQVASGYAAVWAVENTREALFDAMRRREVYATTGSRINVRFFGGWGFSPDDDDRPDLARRGYAGGVPMGADLPPRPPKHDGGPTFLVAALKDPEGANLDRIQIVKGWLDAQGEPREKVFDVAWSGKRKKDDEGRLPSVGSSVDTETASYTNSIGAAQLSTVWTDPDFDREQSAFYYVRVIEIPTPRWTAHDARFFAIEAPIAAPATTQERAYTSPVWYAP